jgi:hypothetical protein
MTDVPNRDVPPGRALRPLALAYGLLLSSLMPLDALAGDPPSALDTAVRAALVKEYGARAVARMQIQVERDVVHVIAPDMSQAQLPDVQRVAASVPGVRRAIASSRGREDEPEEEQGRR